MLTCVLLSASLIALVTSHLVNLLRHRAHVTDDQLVKIAVAELANAQDAADGEFVLLVKL